MTLETKVEEGVHMYSHQGEDMRSDVKRPPSACSRVIVTNCIGQKDYACDMQRNVKLTPVGGWKGAERPQQGCGNFHYCTLTLGQSRGRPMSVFSTL